MTTQTSATDLIPLPQIAEAAGVTERTLRRWITDGDLPVYTHGNRSRHYLMREDAERLLSPRQIDRRRRSTEPVRA
jgi:predicted site-specific integrase-resolvase